MAEILHVVTSNDRRGAEVFAVDLDAALGDRGHDSRLLALVDGRSDNRLAVRALGTRPLHPAALHKLRVEARRAAIVVAHGAKALPACALGLAGLDRPFVYRSIGDPLHWVTTTSRRLRVGMALRRADAVVALWPQAADTLARVHRLDRDRVRVIPNGVPGARFPLADRARRAAARTRLGIEADAQVVLYLGALSAEKNVEGVIAAGASVGDAVLLVVGGGPERSRLERVASELAPGRVLFLGGTSEPDQVLAAADVLVLASHSEGMPAVLIEAGLCGLPVVVSDVGGVSEVVHDGETGLLVPVGDQTALEKALARALEESSGLGCHARARCLALFEIGVVAEAWDRLLCEVIAARRCRPSPP